jgi:DNA-binding SARP family transcriptional activator/tetratricopeptide (TPR) repeat protein
MVETQTNNNHLRASLFGVLRIEQGGQEVTLPGLANARTLLAYLLLYNQHPHSREVVAGRLWPDMSEMHSRRRLSHAILHVRQCLPDLLHVEPKTLGISSQVHLWTDAAEFRDLLAPQLADVNPPDTDQARLDLRQAIKLYQGDILEGMYDDWVLAERERLEGLYLSALERLIQLEKLASCYGEALAAAQTLVSVDPLRESAHREIMRLSCLLGRPESALRQFELCHQLLADELGAPPEDETLELAREITDYTSQMVTPSLPVGPQPVSFLDGIHSAYPPFVGRKNERAELSVLVEAACGGTTNLVLLEGEAGVGKTRLLQETARDAQWRGAQVLWGKGKELEASGPYGLILEALNSGLSPLRARQIVGLLRDWQGNDLQQGARPAPVLKSDGQVDENIWIQVLCALLPALADELPSARGVRPAPLEPAQEHLRLVEAISHLLLAWVCVMPLILILEDLHWAERDTLDALIRLAEWFPDWSARGRMSRGVLFIGSYRGEEARSRPDVWERLQSLDRLSTYNRLSLSRLNPDTTSELVSRSLGIGQPAPLFEARLYHETGGNPLFVLETLRYLYGEKLLWREADGSWSTPFDDTTTDYAELPLSPLIEGVISRRLAQLSPELQRILNAAAVLGNQFDFSTLAAVTGLKTTAALAALSTLVQQGFIQEMERHYRFCHDKMRLVIYNSLSVEAKIRLHRQTAQAIEKTDPVEVLAHHWTYGQTWDRAVHYHRLAAEDALAAHAYAAAVEHLSTALRMLAQAQLEAERFELLKARETALDILAEREAQSADLDAMLQCTQGDVAGRVHVLCRQAELSTNLGQYEKAETSGREALTLAKSCGSKAGQAAALIILGLAVSRLGQATQALHYLREAVEISREGTDRKQETRAYSALSRGLMLSEQYAEAQVHARLALALYEELGDQCGQAQVLNILGAICMEQLAADASIAYCSRALQIAREIGYRAIETRALNNLGNMFWLKGKIAQALQHYNEAHATAHTIRDRRLEHVALMNLASLQHHMLGDDDSAWSKLQIALAHWEKVDDPMGREQCWGTLGDIARCRGDLAAARTFLETSIADSLDSGSRWMAIQHYIYLVHLDLQNGDPATALKDLETVETMCRDLSLTGWTVKLLDLRGLVLLALGQSQAALVSTSQAMAQLSPSIEQGYLIPFHHSRVLSALDRVPEAQAALGQSYQQLSEILSDLAPEQQRMSWEKVPEHRAVLAEWQALHPPNAVVRLPLIDAPTGRPLRDDEWVEIHWTITTAEDDKISDKAERRHQRLLRLLHEAEEQGAAPTVDDLAAALDVGKATIKRDLATLRQSGHPIRTRGSRNTYGGASPEQL